MKNPEKIGIRDIPRLDKWFILSFQHLCAMFGATILVPFLVDLSPSVALLSSGLGTLAYLFITKGQIPAYLGSSFAFIAPILSATALGGPEGAMIGSFFAGLVYGIVALLIKQSGVKWILQILPPIVVGPVIIVIGLGLAPTAIDMAMNVDGAYSSLHFTVALITLAITVIASMFFKGFFGLVPIMFGIIGGYVTAYFVGIVDLTPIGEASWLAAPAVIIPFVTYAPEFNWKIVAIIAPIAVVTIAEHIGDQMVLSKVVGKNFIEKPGLHRSILGDGVATMIASLIGGPPNTTYGENIGVLAITRVFSVFVIAGAAVMAICFAFIGKISAIISTIPAAVMGGVSILLFGVIASSGLRMLIDNQIDLGAKRNLIISSVILVLGVGGAFIQVSEDMQIPGMALATLVGIVLHLVLPDKAASYSKKPMFQEEEENEEVA
ncbi:NCS2 family nucleobase:cation symporter [Alkalihalobacillus oceani]|uniref:NCS2 family nucleobase:cation symporter n=1 Tax=Halalkalibacter oceani TaxID=1653776 RepID=A0A9X2DPP9_9BACI|nr:solute carrier family 23 protein [Halalkalibacter oceani]MCM3713127.1 NCS2 family nucleobase:cation symporter [Halalkalibacter oceani]